MPSDDLILNVRQIAGYAPSGIQPTDSVVFQRGLGGPYLSTNALDFVGNALAEAGPMSVGNQAPPDTAAPQLFTDGLGMVPEGQLMWNCYVGGGQEKMVAAGAGGRIVVGTDGSMVFQSAAPTGAQTVAQFLTTLELSPTGYATVGEQILLARDPISPLEAATAQWVGQNTVTSFNGRSGATVLQMQDIVGAGGALLFSPVFGGCPRAPTPHECSYSSRLATTAFVQRNSVRYIDQLLATQPFVFTFNGRSGDVVLTAADFEGVTTDLLNNAALTGVPTAPTAPLNTTTDQIATCLYVSNQISAAGFAPLDSPNFTGYATSITAPPGTNDGQIATCAFVQAAVAAGVAGVASFNGRVGAVVLDAADITAAGGAPIASPAFTGTPTAPLAAPGTSTDQIASTAFVAANSLTSFNTRTGAIVLTAADITSAGGAVLFSPAFTGVPTAPTAATGTTTGQLATTAFVMNEINAVNAGVISFNGRTGIITLNSGDVSAAGGATLSSPAFVNVPTAPTAAVGTSTNQLATTAFVQAAIAAAPAAVTSFNGRTGAVTLSAADVNATAAGGPYLALAGGTMTGNLILSASAAGLVGNAISGASGTFRMLFGQTAGSNRWALILGDSTADAAGNAGSNFGVWAYDNTGAGIGAALSITRATLAATFGGALGVTGALSCNAINMNGAALSGCGNINAATLGSIAGITMVNANLSTAGTVTAQILAANGNLTAPNATIGGIGFSGSGNFSSPGTLSVTALQMVNAGGIVINSGSSLNYVGLIFMTGGNIESANNGASCGIAGAAFFQCAAYNFAQQSDARGKRDITLAPPGALDKVAEIPVHDFDYLNPNRLAPSRHIGWLAQEVQEVAPANVLVGDDPARTLSVELGAMLATLWQAVQELTAKVATLEAKAA
jgi:hypothetical protein